MTEFKTYITFKGAQMQCSEDTTKENLQPTILRLMRGAAAQAGMIEEVKIVETSSDCVVFLAKNNQVVFPPQEK